MHDYASAYGITQRQARRRIDKLEQVGRIVRAAETRPQTDDEGNVVRGRPYLLYQVNGFQD